MHKMIKRIFILVFLLAGCTLSGAEIRVGVASKVITPEIPVWLSGYASRSKPAEEILHDLRAKALVIEENKSRRIIPGDIQDIITSGMDTKLQPAILTELILLQIPQ